MKDVSDLLPGDPISALVPTSQEGGNMRASNEEAMTAPGSPPVDQMQPAGTYFLNDPHVTASNSTKIQPATDGKPQASGQHWTPPGPPGWKKPVIPETVRKDM